MVLEQLEPSQVWKIFEGIFIPTYRSSGFEQQIAQKIINWVDQHKEYNISLNQDKIGNILLKKRASFGCESYPSLILQGHMDMVTETDLPGGYDFKSKPIPLKLSDDHQWVYAERTTLGADNGIGVSMALSLLTLEDKEFSHGPIEVLITVSEETGLDGAFALDPQKLTIQSRLMINIDSEEIGFITIGSAGGGEIELHKKIQDISKEEIVSSIKDNLAIYELTVKGLFGGHSGVDIHLPRGNAIKIMANILSLTCSVSEEIYIHSWIGGNKRNAIPRDVSVIFGIPERKKQNFVKKLQDNIQLTLKYFAQTKPDGNPIEKNINIQFKSTNTDRFLNKDASINLIRFINTLPHGITQMSAVIPNLVETSINLAKIRIEKGDCNCDLMARSSIDHDLEGIRHRVEDFAHLNQWEVKLLQAYPGWAPDITQPLFQFVQKEYAKINSQPIRFGAIHAGLECGLIGGKFRGMQMIAIGPDIQNAHTPDERVNVKSVQIIYSLLQECIKNIHVLKG